MFLVDEPRSKPLMWSKILLTDTNFFKNSNQLFEKIIDPRLIYVDQNIGFEEFQKFLDITIPKDNHSSLML